MVKSPPANAADLRVLGCTPRSGRFIPWRRAWQPSPVCLPGESHGQRSLEGYGPWVTESGPGLSDLTCLQEDELA